MTQRMNLTRDTIHGEAVLATQEARVIRLEEIVGEIRDGLNRIDSRMDRIDATIDQIDSRIERIDTRIDRIDDRMDSNFRWVLGVVITMSTTTTLAIIVGFVAVLAKI